MKYLKRMLHCPRGTSNSFILLELGLLPIIELICIKQLMFLHHIMKLPENDTVYKVFQQQGCYPYEHNWRNHIMAVLKQYSLPQDLNVVQNMSRWQWRGVVINAVSKYALRELNQQCLGQSKTAHLCPYQRLEPKQYVKSLPPQDTRTWLKLRGGVYDLKANRPYQYTDTACRACGLKTEDFDHIANNCAEIPRNEEEIYIGDLDEMSLKEVLARFRSFKMKIEADPDK